MSDQGSRARWDRGRRSPSRRDAPLWRQALDGIGMVVAFAAVVTIVGGAMALIVSLLF